MQYGCPSTVRTREAIVAAVQALAETAPITDVTAEQVAERAWISRRTFLNFFTGVDAVITTGGTGFTGRDVTPEAVEPLFEKRMDGFSIAFHLLSHAKIGTSTIQSRATAGVAGATFIFCLPAGIAGRLP